MQCVKCGATREAHPNCLHCVHYALCHRCGKTANYVNAYSYQPRRKHMKVKMFEVRDRATFIPCIGIEMLPTEHHALGIPVINPEEKFLLHRAGYTSDKWTCVLFGRAAGGTFNYDCYNWTDLRDRRTMFHAHFYIREHWNELESGAVIDVEFILGETSQPKETER